MEPSPADSPADRPADNPADASADPHLRLLRALRAYSGASQRYTDAVSRTRHLHRSDLGALGVVLEHSLRGVPVTPSLLARSTGLSPSATTALIDRLEAAGHLEREAHPTDRRSSVLVMTDLARATGRDLYLPLSTAMREVTERHDPAELERLAALLAELTEATEALIARGGYMPGPAPEVPPSTTTTDPVV